MLEVLPLDLDHDGRITPAELERGRDELVRYVCAHYRLRIDSGGDPRTGRLLAARIESVDTTPPSSRLEEQWIDLELRYVDDGIHHRLGSGSRID